MFGEKKANIHFVGHNLDLQPLRCGQAAYQTEPSRRSCPMLRNRAGGRWGRVAGVGAAAWVEHGGAEIVASAERVMCRLERGIDRAVVGDEGVRGRGWGKAQGTRRSVGIPEVSWALGAALGCRRDVWERGGAEEAVSGRCSWSFSRVQLGVQSSRSTLTWSEPCILNMSKYMHVLLYHPLSSPHGSMA
jgi:hypothetical protein